MSNVAIITEASFRKSQREFRHAYSREWGGEPQVTWINADELVETLKSATGATFQLSTRRPLWDTDEMKRVYVLREEQ